MTLRRVVELLEERVAAWDDGDLLSEKDIRGLARRLDLPQEEFLKHWLETIGPRNPVPEQMTALVSRLMQAGIGMHPGLADRHPSCGGDHNANLRAASGCRPDSRDSQ